MSLNNHRNDVQQFMLKLGDKAFDSPTVVNLIEQEVATLKTNLTNKTIVDHQIYDILFLLMELAVHNQTDLDSAWHAGQERKKKYFDMHV
jgi:hypothetical protein